MFSDHVEFLSSDPLRKRTSAGLSFSRTAERSRLKTTYPKTSPGNLVSSVAPLQPLPLRPYGKSPESILLPPQDPLAPQAEKPGHLSFSFPGPPGPPVHANPNRRLLRTIKRILKAFSRFRTPKEYFRSPAYYFPSPCAGTVWTSSMLGLKY